LKQTTEESRVLAKIRLQEILLFGIDESEISTDVHDPIQAVDSRKF